VENYKLLIKPSAAKELDRIPRKDLERIVQKIQGLREDPRGPGSQKLFDQEKYRIRQGDYRIVYTINEDDKVVLIVKVGQRSDIYKS
jgi:mRNA interferase RelE/StbE